jgi:phosphoglycolate phosphatase
MIKAIVFDYDGVIADSFSNVFEVYKKICDHFQVPSPKDIDEFRGLYGYSYTDCLHNLGIAEKDFPEVKNIYKREIVQMDSQIFPGTFELIAKLNEKYKIYLVSASHPEEVLIKIEAFGLGRLFSKIYCGGGQEIRKSALMLDLLNENNFKPEEVVAIGDRAIDYESFKKAGLSDENIIMVTYGWGLDKSQIGQAKVAKSPKEILNFIG